MSDGQRMAQQQQPHQQRRQQASISAPPMPLPLPTGSTCNVCGAQCGIGGAGSNPDGNGGGGGGSRLLCIECDRAEGPLIPLPLPPPAATHWQHGVSAITAGVVTAVFTSPFDVVRTRLAVQQSVGGTAAATATATGTATATATAAAAATPAAPPHYRGLFGSLRTTYREEGVRGLYRGFGPTIIVVPSFWAIYFLSYQELKQRLNDCEPTSRLSAAPLWAKHIMAACGAGAIADVVVNPLFVVRTRMQTQHMRLLHGGSGTLPSAVEAASASASASAGGPGQAVPTRLYTSTWSTLGRLVREEGFMSLFRGVSASLLGLSHVAIHFPLYEHFKVSLPRAREQRRREAQGLPPLSQAASPQAQAHAHLQGKHVHGPGVPAPHTLDLLCASSLSKMIASALTYPHEVIRARMQHSPKAVFSGLRDCARKTVQVEGLAALYKGFGVNLARTVPGAALTLVSYELVLEHLTKCYPPAI